MPARSAPSAPERIARALKRGNIYELFANAFAYPDADRVAALREAARQVFAAEIDVPMMRFAVLAREINQESLEPVYVSLTTFSSSPDCPAFESAYFGSDAQRQAQRMADIAGFYRAFGVDATEGGFRPDELPVELEFMAYLCRKEAYAEEHLGAPRAGQARRAQRLFLDQHLGRWAPVFARKMAEQAPPGHFHSVASQALAGWLREECRAAAVTPQEVPADVAPSWPAPVSHGPEFAGDASFVSLEELAVR